MDEQAFNRYLEERYNDEVKYYNKKSGECKKWNQRFQVTIIVLSAITPVLAILDNKIFNIETKFLTTVVASIVAIASSVSKFMKYEENWVTYRSVCESLTREKYLMEAGISEYARCTDNESKYKLFVERAESIMSKESGLWLTSASSKNTK